MLLSLETVLIFTVISLSGTIPYLELFSQTSSRLLVKICIDYFQWTPCIKADQKWNWHKTWTRTINLKRLEKIKKNTQLIHHGSSICCHIWFFFFLLNFVSFRFRQYTRQFTNSSLVTFYLVEIKIEFKKIPFLNPLLRNLVKWSDTL